MIAAAIAAGAKMPDSRTGSARGWAYGGGDGAKAKRTHYSNTAENIIQEGLEAVGVKLSARAWDAGLAAYYRTVSEAARLTNEGVRDVLSLLVEPRSWSRPGVPNTW